MAGRREGARAHDERRVSVSGEERISTIRAGQGAKVTTRANAAEAATRARRNAKARYLKRHPEARRMAKGPQRSGLRVVVVVLCAIVLLLVIFFVGSCVSGMLTSGSVEQDGLEEQADQDQSDDESEAQSSAQEQADVDGSVTYQGSTYSLVTQESGQMGLVCTDANGNVSTLCEIEGTPVALMRAGATILIPENRDDGTWDIVCYVVGGHAEATYVVGSDGAMVQGTGSISAVELDGTTLHVTDDSGEITDVAVE